MVSSYTTKGLFGSNVRFIEHWFENGVLQGCFQKKLLFRVIQMGLLTMSVAFGKLMVSVARPTSSSTIRFLGCLVNHY